MRAERLVISSVSSYSISMYYDRMWTSVWLRKAVAILRNWRGIPGCAKRVHSNGQKSTARAARKGARCINAALTCAMVVWGYARLYLEPDLMEIKCKFILLTMLRCSSVVWVLNVAIKSWYIVVYNMFFT